MSHRCNSVRLVLAVAVLIGCSGKYQPDPRNQRGCLDRRTVVTADQPLPLGFSAAEVLAFTGGQREAELRWPAAPPTGLRHILESPGLFLVHSDPDPDFPYEIAVSCDDHLLIEGPTALSTIDGQLDERWSAARLRSFDGRAAAATVTVAARDIRGTFQSNLPAGQCLLGLQFNLNFAPGGFSGSIFMTVAGDPCDRIRDLTPVSARDGGSWGTPATSRSAP